MLKFKGSNITDPIIGQEAICPDGLGRVIAFEDNFPHQWVQVSTYIGDRQCKWAPHNVELIDPRMRRNWRKMTNETPVIEHSIRPDCWAFAMDVLGDPEASIVEAYVASLEAEVKRLRDAEQFRKKA